MIGFLHRSHLQWPYRASRRSIDVYVTMACDIEQSSEAEALGAQQNNEVAQMGWSTHGVEKVRSNHDSKFFDNRLLVGT